MASVQAVPEVEAKDGFAGGYNFFTLSRTQEVLQHQRDQIGHAIVSLLRKRRGRMGVAELGRQLGIAERRLQRVCRDRLGTSPRHYARLTRFLVATNALRSEGTPLADLALSCGFSDQAHFQRDFRAFSGMTPRQFRSSERTYYLGAE